MESIHEADGGDSTEAVPVVTPRKPRFSLPNSRSLAALFESRDTARTSHNNPHTDQGRSHRRRSLLPSLTFRHDSHTDQGHSHRRRSLLPGLTFRHSKVRKASDDSLSDEQRRERRERARRMLKQKIRLAKHAQRIKSARKFRGLPSSLVLPHLEITLMVMLVTGQVEAAAEMMVVSLMHLSEAPCAATAGAWDGTGDVASHDGGSAAGANATAQPARKLESDSTDTTETIGINGTNATESESCTVLSPEETIGFPWFLLSFTCLAAVVVWLVWVARLLRHFYRHHSKTCWVPSAAEGRAEATSTDAKAKETKETGAAGAFVVRGPEAENAKDALEDVAAKALQVAEDVVEEMDHVITQTKRSLLSIGTMRRAVRRSGTYEVPEEDQLEPARTEDALAHAMVCCRGARQASIVRFLGALPAHAGLSYNMLTSFLDDGSASRRGTAHSFIAVLLQMAFACAIGGLKRPGETVAAVAVTQVISIGNTPWLPTTIQRTGPLRPLLLSLVFLSCHSARRALRLWP